jgi:superfamily I DNA/RNA helicase
MEWKPKDGNLDESQRVIIKECLAEIRSKGPNTIHKIPWVSGFAGNGKSVVLVHTMEQLADLESSASITFITYTHALKDLVHHSLLPRHRNRIKVQTHTNFISEKKYYDIVFLDEVQDISEKHLEKIRDLSGSLVLAGDFAQSIYPANKPITVDELKRSFKVQEHRLLKMFRLTKRLAEVVIKLLPRGLFTPGEPNPLAQEVPPRLFSFDDSDDEYAWLWGEACLYAKTRSPAVILFPFHKDIENFLNFVSNLEGIGNAPRRKGYRRGEVSSDPYEEINNFFKESKLETLIQVLGSGSGSDGLVMASTKKLVFVMTYHSVKGLDFDTVFVPSLDFGKKLYPGMEALSMDENLENKLLFVALTRSRKNLFMSFSGSRPHMLVQNLGLKPISVDSENANY